jgi:hypothetical protein
MKISSSLAVLALLCAPLTPMISAQAPSMPAAAPTLPCDGVYNIGRISEITPTGSMDKFMAAVAAHQAWYKSHGFPDIIFASRILVADPKTGKNSLSDTQVMTYHLSKSKSAPTPHDAAWDAYVKLYSETSTIKETTMSCIPTAYAPASMK